MQSGVLERIRGLEADVEAHLDSMVQQELFRELIKNERHRILLDHFLLQQTTHIVADTEKLLDAYLDEDDIVEAQEAASDGPDVIAAALKEFEGRVADIREYHLSYRDLPPVRSTLHQPEPAMLDKLFSLAEKYGTCLDLGSHYKNYSVFMITTGTLLAAAVQASHDGSSHTLHADALHYGQDRWESALEYFTFIPQIGELIHSLDGHRKVLGFQLYRTFITELLSYLLDFYHRVEPLSSKDRTLMAEIDTHFEEFWPLLVQQKEHLVAVADEGSSATGSSKRKVSCAMVAPPQLRKYCDAFCLWPLTYINKVLAMAPSGVDGLKATEQQLPHHLDEVREVALAEAKVNSLVRSLLFTAVERTDKGLLRDLSKTAEELELEQNQAQKEFLASMAEVQRNAASTMEGTVAQAADYQLQMQRGVETAQGGPKDQPVEEEQELIGEDGLPIPKWLVELQQLTKSYTCDVCGGTVYKGPKVFREHFGDERHTEGLRRLGVTQDLKEYEGITAPLMVKRMRERLASKQSDAASHFRRRLREDHDREEFEDIHGRLISTKDFHRFQTRRE